VRGLGDIGVREDGELTQAGNSFEEDFLALAVEFRRQKADPGRIAAGPRQ
jgi:hypothetical protein